MYICNLLANLCILPCYCEMMRIYLPYPWCQNFLTVNLNVLILIKECNPSPFLNVFFSLFLYITSSECCNNLYSELPFVIPTLLSTSQLLQDSFKIWNKATSGASFTTVSFNFFRTVRWRQKKWWFTRKPQKKFYLSNTTSWWCFNLYLVIRLTRSNRLNGNKTLKRVGRNHEKL